MSAQQQKVSFLLNGSLDNQTTEELRGPLLQQNGSPSLSESRNTRLSLEPGTCTRAPDVQPIGVTLNPAAPAFAIVGSNRKRNYALYTTSNNGTRECADDGRSARGTGFVLDKTGKLQQNAYLPVQVSRAGQIPGVMDFQKTAPTGSTAPLSGISVAYNELKDELWYVWTGLDPFIGPVRMACVYDAAGTLIAAPQIIYTHTVLTYKAIGITAHGAAGMRMWFTEQILPTPVGVYMVALSVNQNAIVAAAPQHVCYDIGQRYSVASDGGSNAFLCGRLIDPGTFAGTDGLVRKINVTTGAVVGDVLRAGAAPDQYTWSAISYARIGGVGYLAAIWNPSNLDEGQKQLTGIYLETLAAVKEGARPTDAQVQFEEQPVAAQLLACPDMNLLGAAYAVTERASYSSDPYDYYFQTAFWFQPASSSAAGHEGPVLYNTILHDKGATWQPSSSEAYPLFFLTKAYGGRAEVLDQALHGYIMGYAGTSPWLGSENRVALNVSPFVRLGCVRGNMSPVYATDERTELNPPMGALPFIGQELVVPYRKADLEHTGRFARVSFVPEQPAVAHDREGVALIGAGMCAQWDGVETVEYGGPLHAPMVQLFKDPVGGGTPTPAGSYGFSAVYEWTDQAGLFHRSMPAPTVSMTFGAPGSFDEGILRARVTVPQSMRDGIRQHPVTIVLYATGTNGTSYHAAVLGQEDDQPYVELGGAPAVTFFAESDRIIYSRGLAGEEIVPQPPPPLRDVAIIGSRAWGVDAEVPSRVVYSKLRVAGIGFEFSPALEVIVPSAAGDVLAVRELAGTIMLFAERGIFQLSDGGPNNMGQGGSFGPPYRVSETSTSARRSVLGTPVGILFHDNAGGYSMLAGGQPTQLPGASFDGQVVGGYLMEDAEEAVIIEGAVARVFNYALGRWSLWDLPTVPILAAQSALSRDVGLLYAQTTARTYTHDSHVLHPTALMRWETDWILFGGDVQDYAVAYELLFNAYSVSDHAIRIELLTEYNGTVATTLREWTAAELAALFVGPNRRYTVKIESVRQDARAFKIRIQELTNTGTHRGMRPGLATVIYSIDGLTYEEAIIPGSLK